MGAKRKLSRREKEIRTGRDPISWAKAYRQDLLAIVERKKSLITNQSTN